MSRIEAIEAIDPARYTDHELIYLSNFEGRHPILAEWVAARRILAATKLPKYQCTTWHVKRNIYDALRMMPRDNIALWCVSPVQFEVARRDRLKRLKRLMAKRDALMAQLHKVRQEIKRLDY